MKDDQGDTPLHLACREGNANVMRALVSFPTIDVNTRNNRGQKVLHNSYPSIFAELLAAPNIDVSSADNDGVTPLHKAVTTMPLHCIEALLSCKNVDVNCRTNSGETPLFFAATEGRGEVVRRLLKAANINVNDGNDQGCTPLHVAQGTALDALLSSPHVNVNAVDNEGNTPLHTCVKNRDVGEDSDIHRLEVLLEHFDVNLNARNRAGQTPLHLYLSMDKTQNCEFLLGKHGIDLSVKCDKHRTMLHYAAMNYSKDATTADKLWRFGSLIVTDLGNIGVNAKADYGTTAIHVAAYMVNRFMIEFLLTLPGLDVNAQDMFGNTALHLLARKPEAYSALELLLTVPSINVNAQNNDRETPLHLTAKWVLRRTDLYGDSRPHSNCSVAAKALVRIPNVRVNLPNKYGNTPLHYAVIEGNEDIVKILIASPRIDFSVENCYGLTPIACVFELLTKARRKPQCRMAIEPMPVEDVNAYISSSSIMGEKIVESLERIREALLENEPKRE